MTITEERLEELIQKFRKGHIIAGYVVAGRVTTEDVVDALTELRHYRHPSGPRTKVLRALERAEISLDDARHMRDEDLVKIKGIGKRGVRYIRE